MFEHSVRVPRLYKLAAKVAKQVKEEGASLKDKIYQIKHINIKGLYALITTLFQKSNTLDYIIRSSQILMKENRLDPWLARVLITELLWGKMRLPNDNKPCQTIINYSKELTDCLATLPDDVPTTQSNKVKINKPRYVRVNTLKLTMNEAINIFRDEGWILIRCGDNCDYGSFLATVASLSFDQFVVDMHVKDLLVFPPNTHFYKHHLYLNGDIILQDKASCLAPLILSPELKSSVLDMCSAPGMKASYLAAIVGREGTVYAIERDQRRYQTLVKLTEGMGAENIKCINKDVLTVTDREFPDVEYILVDPSCSGSGMLNRVDYEDPGSKFNQSRLQSLAGFQITILRHALNNFPNVKRVLYSTCSVYPEENESVVEQVITTVKDFKLVDLKKQMKSNWFNFGAKDFKNIGERCLYAKPEDDYTTGFFVALFERLNDGETNEFFVRRVKRSSECDNEAYKDGNKENDNPKDAPKSKKNKFDQQIVQVEENNISAEGKGKKKKSKDKEASTNITLEEHVSEECIKKNKKKSKHSEKEESTPEESNKKKKKKSKHNEEETDVSSPDMHENISEETKPKKKNKSKNDETIISDIDTTQEVSGETNKRKKKKSNNENDESSNVNESVSEETKPKKKKSKTSDVDTTQEISSNFDQTVSEETNSKKKKKTKTNETILSDVDNTIEEISDEIKQKKKKKLKKDPSNEEHVNENNEDIVTENKKRKKKHDINDCNEVGEGESKKKKKSKHTE